MQAHREHPSFEPEADAGLAIESDLRARRALCTGRLPALLTVILLNRLQNRDYGDQPDSRQRHRRARRRSKQSPRAPKSRRCRDQFVLEFWNPRHLPSIRARTVPSPRLTRLRTTASEQRRSFAMSP